MPKVVVVTLKVFVPDEIIAGGNAEVEQYLNDRLHQEPEFFGDIDQGCFVVTDEQL